MFTAEWHPDDLGKVLTENPATKGVFVVNPTYYGVCSDLKAIGSVCHKNGIPLIVDEAHGAHLYFSDKLPGGAIDLGADACVQSIHKVTGSLTQSSMLHINYNSLIDEERIAANLHIVQSTSPSYILMTSLDMARHELATSGEEMITRAVELADYGRREINAIGGMNCMGGDIVGAAAVKDLDTTRLTISARELGITGFDLKRILFEEFSVDTELADWLNVLAIVTFANEPADLERLITALQVIARKYKTTKVIKYGRKCPISRPTSFHRARLSLRLIEKIKWADARGRIAADMIAPYPPGIPVIYPGERVNAEIWEYIERFRREERHLHGPADSTLETFKVIKE